MRLLPLHGGYVITQEALAKQSAEVQTSRLPV